MKCCAQPDNHGDRDSERGHAVEFGNDYDRSCNSFAAEWTSYNAADNNFEETRTVTNETRDFPTAVIASLSSGVMLCTFSEIHEAAEFLMGHPIWTHHFASKALCEDMKRTIAEQCPGMPTVLHGVTAENYTEHVARLELELGKTVSIRKGSGRTEMLPMDGIPDHLKDKTIVIEGQGR